MIFDRYTPPDLALEHLFDGMDKRLTIAENLHSSVVSVVSPGANVEFTVTHNLGKTPSFYIWNVDTNAVVYDSRRNAWTTSSMYLKCSAPGVTITLVVL